MKATVRTYRPPGTTEVNGITYQWALLYRVTHTECGWQTDYTHNPEGLTAAHEAAHQHMTRCHRADPAAYGDSISIGDVLGNRNWLGGDIDMSALHGLKPGSMWIEQNHTVLYGSEHKGGIEATPTPSQLGYPLREKTPGQPGQVRAVFRGGTWITEG